MSVFLFLFIVMPVAEMAVLIKVGGIIGVLNTIGLVLLTAVIGAWLLRQQGLATLLKANQRLNSGELPAKEVAEGLILRSAAHCCLLLVSSPTPSAFCACFRALVIGWRPRP